MANHPSAEKRNRQRITRTTRNRTLKSSVRTLVKRLRTEIGAKNKETALKALATAISEIDKAASKGVVHPKAASRTIGRLSAQVHKLSIAPAAPAAEAKAPKAVAAAAQYFFPGQRR